MASSSSSTLQIKWADEGILKAGTHYKMREKLQQLAPGNFRIYENLNECVMDILNETKEKNVILIVSNASGSKIVPIIHAAPCLRAVYIFCGNIQRAEEWTGPYISIIDGIFTESPALVQSIDQLLHFVPAYSLRDTEPLPMSAFRVTDQQRGLRNLQKESATFIWYQLLIEVIRQLGGMKCSKDDIIQVARTTYGNEQRENRTIDTFEKDYISAKAIYWYSLDSFVYRLLNRALRTENIDIVFKFRLFINDLHQEIKKLHQRYLNANQPIATHTATFYRGQRLRKEEMEMIKESVNGIVSMNTFLSATSKYEVAQIYAGTDGPRKALSPEPVIFVIKIVGLTPNTTPFAKISQSSCFPEEREVLFTIGAIFKVLSIDFNSDPKRIHLQLIDQEDPLYREFFEHTLQQIGHGRASPLTLGWFLYRMNDFIRAEYYAELLLKQDDLDDIDGGNAHNLLGLIYKARGRLEDAIEAYEKALEILRRCDEQGSPRLIVCHYNIALAHLAAQDERSANDHYLEALDLFNNSSHHSNLLLQSMMASLKGQVEAAFGFMDSAIETLKMALETKKQNLPEWHAAIGSAWKDLGKAYFQKGDEENALHAFDEAIQIFDKILVEKHIDCYECHVQKGQICFNRQEYGLASIEFTKGLHILTKHTPGDLRSIDELQTLIKDAKAVAYFEDRRA